MLEPEENEKDFPEINTEPTEQSPKAGSEPDSASEPEPAARTEETDRVDGEYHYKNGYTQRIYSDAHYVPADESTVPPRYYTPPERVVKEPRHRSGGKNGAALKLICACLVCALLGGCVGSVITSGRLSGRVAAMEQSLQEAEAARHELVVSEAEPIATDAGTQSGLSGESVYALACKQVVGISSEISYQSFFGMTSAPVSGTGFVVSEDGYIVTNYHVVEDAVRSGSAITVMMHDGTAYEAAFVGAEESNDVAVLKIDAAGLTPVAIGNSDSISVGNEIFAVGNPLGVLDFSMSTGHVSALDRLITTSDSSDAINMFQIDAAVNSGNSGGPVYNDRGQVIGIVSAKYSQTGVEGLGFAIPINDAVSIVNDLITKGYVTGKAYMGVRLDSRYTSVYAQYYGMPMGAYVYSVDPGSCAETAGIQAGDIITRLGEHEVSDYDALKSAVKSFSAGDTAEVVLYRAGVDVTVSITFDEAVPESASGAATKTAPEISGN